MKNMLFIMNPKAGRTTLKNSLVDLGGNIGAALLPMLPEVSPEDVAVVELSSFQLISMHASPNIAVVTNVTPNHLDHPKDVCFSCSWCCWCSLRR